MNNRKIRTFLSAILFITMLLSTAVLFSACGDVDGSDSLTYELNADKTGYIVTGCEKKNAKEITIPSTYQGLPVVEIGESAFQNSDLYVLVLPEGLERIGHSAFVGNGNIKTLDIPDSVTYIGNNAFGSFHNYATVENGVVYCDGWVIESEEDITKVTLKEGTVGIAERVFESNETLTEVTFSSELLYICNRAFYGCENLKMVNGSYATQLKTISKDAFCYCNSLSNFSVNSSSLVVDPSAFDNCPELENIPGSVEK